ncbi:hypothetical protein AMECASPLE_005920 [Ameca splendens]|uniref:Uncharacterized protein n=1 Tax=Ameca splendens TaxID=208324 RepID=A0ABV0XNC7_9TELE
MAKSRNCNAECGKRYMNAACLCISGASFDFKCHIKGEERKESMRNKRSLSLSDCLGDELQHVIQERRAAFGANGVKEPPQSMGSHSEYTSASDACSCVG